MFRYHETIRVVVCLFISILKISTDEINAFYFAFIVSSRPRVIGNLDVNLKMQPGLYFKILRGAIGLLLADFNYHPQK